MPTSRKQAPQTTAGLIRNRIKDFRPVPGAELVDNDRNWRLHPYAQKRAIAESLETVGIADVLIAYESKRNKGKLTLIDGHARTEDWEELDWPTIILDVTDEEADLLLLTLDPMTAMAETDGAALRALLDEVGGSGLPATEDLLRTLAAAAEADGADGELGDLEEGEGPPEMALQAFEHYDYIMVVFRNALDWSQAKEKFGLQDEGFTLRDGVTRKVGLGRVVDGRRLLELLRDAEAA